MITVLNQGHHVLICCPSVYIISSQALGYSGEASPLGR